ncbi:MAG TPA: hypothetical protein VNV38_02140, partial [Stellaceae bacterium]|nr:hypothetical protein [Stellaceae bacterium]
MGEYLDTAGGISQSVRAAKSRLCEVPCANENRAARRPPCLFLAETSVAYGATISTRRFCGSRTPGAVGTRLSFSPRP